MADLQAADDGFDALLSQWRRWHWSPIEGSDKKMPAPATDGVIALAQMGVMPPRNVKRRPDAFEEQHDAMCWFQSKGRAWRVWRIQDGWLIVNSFGEEWHIDLKKMKWDNYVAAAAAALMGSPITPATGEPLEGAGHE